MQSSGGTQPEADTLNHGSLSLQLTWPSSVVIPMTTLELTPRPGPPSQRRFDPAASAAVRVFCMEIGPPTLSARTFQWWGGKVAVEIDAGMLVRVVLPAGHEHLLDPVRTALEAEGAKIDVRQVAN